MIHDRSQCIPTNVCVVVYKTDWEGRQKCPMVRKTDRLSFLFYFLLLKWIPIFLQDTIRLDHVLVGILDAMTLMPSQMTIKKMLLALIKFKYIRNFENWLGNFLKYEYNVTVLFVIGIRLGIGIIASEISIDQDMGNLTINPMFLNAQNSQSFLCQIL